MSPVFRTANVSCDSNVPLGPTNSKRRGLWCFMVGPFLGGYLYIVVCGVFGLCLVLTMGLRLCLHTNSSLSMCTVY